jgi:hypothetical protein
MSSPDPFAPIGGSGAATPAKRKAWSIITPVPDAPAPPAEHFKLGKPSVRWTYTNSTGAVLGTCCGSTLQTMRKNFARLRYGGRPTASRLGVGRVGLLLRDRSTDCSRLLMRHSLQ